MANLKYILKEMRLLTEDAQVNDINDAITGMHPAMIVYNDMKGMGGKSKRKIYPVAYGISTAGKPVIRAFQTAGSSKRGVPKWKLFRLDRITIWKTNPDETYEPENLVGINKDGDKQMSTLYTIAPIGNGKKISSDLKGLNLKASYIDKKDVNIEGEPNKKDADAKEDEVEKQVNANDVVNKIVSDIAKKNVENNQQNSYNSSEWDNQKIETHVDSPITNGQIGAAENGNDENPVGVTDTEATDEPIMKSDLEKKEDETEDDEDKAKNPMTDLMNRMDNLDNNEEEKEI